MPKCSACSEEKPESEFPKRGKKCRVCHNKWHNDYYHAKNKEKHTKKIKEQNRSNKRERQRKFLEYLQDKCCAVCGEGDQLVLEFDHIDPSQKENTVSNLVNGGSWTKWERVWEEIQKCQILCANCHRRKTAKQCNHWKYKLLVEQNI